MYCTKCYFGCFRHLDWLNLMAYDLHGSWDATTGIGAPLYARPGERGAERQLNVVRVLSPLDIGILNTIAQSVRRCDIGDLVHVGFAALWLL